MADKKSETPEVVEINDVEVELAEIVEEVPETKNIVVYKVEGGDREIKAVKQAIEESLTTGVLVIPETIHVEVTTVPKESTFVVQNVAHVKRFQERAL